jgi:peptidoglycan/LPS O-acetylase OafA/YrhL
MTGSAPRKNRSIKGYHLKAIRYITHAFGADKILNLFKQLKVYQLLTTNNRISSLDVFRAIAIIAVVFYHFHQYLPFGNIGVDLFFVISGFLVGGILIKEFNKEKAINIPRFLLQRGFKIWPSYYFFLLFGSLIVFLFYHNSHPEQIIPFREITRYALFYQNYVPNPDHWSFGHVWSLCVEEHFYIMLPVILFLIYKLVSKKNHTKALYAMVFAAIFLGMVFKYYSLYYTESRDTYLRTQNRIDALAWGVLLYLIISQYGEKLKQIKNLYILSLIGMTVFVAAIIIDNNTTSEKYHNIILHSAIAPCFFLLILGVYHRDFSRFYLLRTVGYFSYNWYLWHPMFVSFISDRIGKGIIGLTIYTVISFLMAALTTILIEEPVLQRRKSLIAKLFPNHKE